MEISYQSASIKKSELSDKIQFSVAALSLVVGYVDTFNSFTGWMLILPILGFVIAAVNGVLIIWYNSFKEKFGKYFEIQAFRVNGAILMLTAFGYHFEGNHSVQYVYYLLAIIYFIVLPRVVVQFRSRCNLSIENDGITDNKSTRKLTKYDWKEIKKVIVDSEKLEILVHNTKVKKHYFTDTDESNLNKLLTLLKDINRDNKFELLVNE